VIELIPLRDLLLKFPFVVLVVVLGAVVFRPVLLELEFLFDVVEIILIHLGEEIF
jgi:hypothetical protein